MNICMPLRSGSVNRMFSPTSRSLWAFSLQEPGTSQAAKPLKTLRHLTQCSTRGFSFLQQSPMNCYLSNFCCNYVVIFILLRLFMYAFIYYCAMSIVFIWAEEPCPAPSEQDQEGTWGQDHLHLRF